MTAKNISDRKVNEGPIARARRRARELGEDGLALAKCEADQIIQGLGREPDFAERRCIEHFAILDVRVRTLRAWNLHEAADDATSLLMKALGELKRIRSHS